MPMISLLTGPIRGRTDPAAARAGHLQFRYQSDITLLSHKDKKE